MKWILALLPLAITSACGDESSPDSSERTVRKSTPIVRAARRAYDGAPPTIPHREMGAACTSCHNAEGLEVPELGYAPPSPHEKTRGLSSMSHCTQCHVFQVTDTLLVENDFVGRPQTLEPGSRAYEGAPPRLPHPVFMRENCLACHSGSSAREPIRTSHPERRNCRQCHVPMGDAELFARASG